MLQVAFLGFVGLGVACRLEGWQRLEHLERRDGRRRLAVGHGDGSLVAVGRIDLGVVAVGPGKRRIVSLWSQRSFERTKARRT